MVLEMVGLGSQYAIAFLDVEGNYLDGSKKYSLNIPANVPAKDFGQWLCTIHKHVQSYKQASLCLA